MDFILLCFLGFTLAGFWFFWGVFFWFLILVECMMVVVYFFLFANMYGYFYSFELTVLFLSLMVIEGSFGLAMVIYMTFFSGFFFSFFLF